MRLGGALKAYRQLHDMTATELAGKMGVSPGVVARLERGDEIRSRQMAAVLLWLFGTERATERAASSLSGETVTAPRS